jgi:hypothetical protein
VYRLIAEYSISTNGIALWLLAQVHIFSQHDDDKEGGTEHGGVSGVVVGVAKLQLVHGDASGVRRVWQWRRFVAAWIGKDLIFIFA